MKDNNISSTQDPNYSVTTGDSIVNNRINSSNNIKKSNNFS